VRGIGERGRQWWLMPIAIVVTLFASLRRAVT
jgi:hypothetical protein